MKTLQTLTAAFLIVFSMSAFAANEPSSKRAGMNHAVLTYIDAFTQGDTRGLPAILDENVKFSSTKADKVVSYNRSQIVQSLKQLQNIKQNCETSYSVMEYNNAQALVKVNMIYQDFTKVNYVLMENTSEGWKIKSVTSTYN
ncbi:MAG: nuclear transport factor 2 family protein [Arcticibacter sp.]